MPTYPSDALYPGPDVVPSPDDSSFDPWLEFLATTITTINVDDLDVDSEYEIQIRAVTTDGVASDWTDSVYFTTPHDVTPPSVPSTPIVTSKLGVFSIQWDGHTVDGGVMEPDWSHLLVLANGFIVGTINTKTGDTVVWAGGSYAVDYEFTLISVDTAGNASEPSEGVTQQVTPLVPTDLIGKIISGANIINGTINAADAIIGKTITGDLIQANTITADHLAANSVTADKLEVGFLDGQVISGATLNAVNSLAVGTRTAFNDTGTGWWFSSSGYANVKDLSGNTFLTINPKDATQYVQIGNSTGNYLKYTVNTGELAVIGNMRTTPGVLGGSLFVHNWTVDNSVGAFIDISHNVGTLFDLGDGTGATIYSTVSTETNGNTGDDQLVGGGGITMASKGETDYLALGGSFDMYSDTYGALTVGGNGTMELTAKEVHMQTSTGDDGAGVVILDDGTDFGTVNVQGIMFTPQTVTNTNTGSANVHISGPGGQLWTVVSAAKYKADISEIDSTDAILNITPKSWYDKTAADRWADAITAANGDEKKLTELAAKLPDPMIRIPGVIAEDVEAAGLDLFVNHEPDGSIAGVQYDRLWITLIPIVKKQRDQLSAQSDQLTALRTELDALKASINEGETK